MGAIFAFKCQSCGDFHEGSPSFSFESPWYYNTLNEEQRLKANLGSDGCVIEHDAGMDRFVRVMLEIPIHGVAEPFSWGVWASLSEQSFDHYFTHWDTPDESAAYFGWFSNRLPWYPDTLGLKVKVRPRAGGLCPYLELEPNDHLLTQHLTDGISVSLAQDIAQAVWHPG